MAVALIEDLVRGIAESINETLGGSEHEIPREHLAGCVLSALGTSYYRLACSVVAMAASTPEERAELQERNRAGVIEALHKMCHGLSLVGDVPVMPKPNRLLN